MDCRRTLGVALGVGLMIFAPGAALGDDENGRGSGQHGEETESHAAHEFEHGRAHKNEVAVFLGGTEEPGHETEFTWGLDYKRRFAERWAVGMVFDYAGGELRNAIVAPSISFWPGLGGLQLLAAAGVEFHRGSGEADHHKSDGGHGVDEDETYFLVRFGVGYDIHLGKRFGLVPLVSLDFVNDEEVWVYGFAITYGF